MSAATCAPTWRGAIQPTLGCMGWSLDLQSSALADDSLQAVARAVLEALK